MNTLTSRELRQAVLALVVVWTAMVVIVEPRGDFPLADDWNYAASVRTMLTEHRYAPSVYTEAALVAQAMYGALVCSIFGFSFTTLRLSTLVLGWCGGVSLYVLARAAGARHGVALVCALFAITSPLYFVLSSTFMTDIPFFAFGSAGVAAIAVAIRSGRRGLFFAGVVLIALATITRQVGLVLAAACAAGCFSSGRLTPKHVLYSALPLAGAGAAFGAYYVYLRITPAPETLLMFREQQVIDLITTSGIAFARRVAMGAIATFLYVGLAVAPCAIVIELNAHRGAGAQPARARWMWIAGCAAAVMILFWRLDKFLPVTGDFLTVSGIGGLTLAGAESLPRVGTSARVALTMIAVVTGVWILARCFDDVRSMARALLRDGRLTADMSVRLICLAAIAIYIPLIVPLWVYDRYLIPVICLTLIAVAPANGPRLNRRAGIAAALLIALQAAVSVAGTHDYLAWNRARWQAAADWAGSGRAMDLFDAGREVNAWVSYDADESLDRARTIWNREHATVRLAFACEPGATVVREYPYPTWLVPGGRSLCLMQIAGR
jgi:hypothetical protein